ncbi:MAG: signal recognition particle-docking protein FtsY [Firmicutes bacterium]|nr:signal recognition particle-docking protein FtsY [Bacillota bacterium]
MGIFGFLRKKKPEDKVEEIIEQPQEQTEEPGVTPGPDTSQVEEEAVVQEEITTPEPEPTPDPEPIVQDAVEETPVIEEPKPQPKAEPKPTPATTEKAKEQKGLFRKFFGGLKKTASAIGTGIASIFVGTELDDDFYEELEALLLSSDMGVEATLEIVEDIRKHAKREGIRTTEELKYALCKSLTNLLYDYEIEYMVGDEPTALMIVGVNGVGKTTTIGKLSAQYRAAGKSVLVAAADTFRAAACEQLETWTKRAGVRIVTQGEGADPGAVVFDAVNSARAKRDDLLIIDTAGRLHNKAHLMEELKKIDRVVERNWPDVTYRKLLVVDATTGQNALSQVELFNAAVDLDGVILTKLDGTAKGGVVVAIKKKFNLPVVYCGVGEKIDDLIPFSAESFAKALVGLE